MKALLLLLALLPAVSQAKPWWLTKPDANELEFLAPDQAFRVSARIDGRLLRIRFDIADGYYLYRSKFEIRAESPDLTLDPPVFPRGLTCTDPYLGTLEIYARDVEAVVGFERSDAGAHPIELRVTYQGCAEAGLCYPPISTVLFPMPADPTTRITPILPRRTTPAWIPLAILAGIGGFLASGWRRRASGRSPHAR